MDAHQIMIFACIVAVTGIGGNFVPRDRRIRLDVPPRLKVRVDLKRLKRDLLLPSLRYVNLMHGRCKPSRSLFLFLMSLLLRVPILLFLVLTPPNL